MSKFYQGWFLSKKEKHDLENFSKYLNIEQVNEIKSMIKEKKAGIYYDSMKNSLIEPFVFPQLNCLLEDRNLLMYINDINNIIKKLAVQEVFKKFSKDAEEKISVMIAQSLGNESAMNAVRKAILYLLFSRERVHILILGDSRSEKEEFLKSILTLSPVSSLYSSQTQNKELIVIRKKKELIKGILPMTNNGVLCVQNLELGKKQVRTPLIDAMEKGRVSYERKDFSGNFKANIRVVATAGPTGVRFIIKPVELIKRQIPFDISFLSRFHVVFLLRENTNIKSMHKHLASQFRIKQEDVNFIKNYIEFCRSKKIEYDEKFDSLINRFIEIIKKDENQFLVSLTQKTVASIIKLAKARAALQLRENVIEQDVKEAIKILRDSLYSV
jgi:DNA replicative helicase MCM subunit Mcm2 (Cdc46/Mcm family)